MRKNKHISKIILASVVAILAMFTSYSIFSNMKSQLHEKQQLIDVMQKTQQSGKINDSRAYAVALDDMKAGEIVSDSDVDFKNFEVQNKDAFENRSDIVNKVLLKDISLGETFTKEHIATISNDDISLREGYRAVTLPAENFEGKSEQMKKGSLVDIYAKGSSDFPVMEDVRIIGLEGSSLTETNISNATAITFEVSADDISDFISSVSKGKVMLVSRNANEKRTSVKRPKKSSYSAGSIPSLPDLPTSVPISNLSGLPQPIQPIVPQQAVEVIEANVKSKVTFD